MVLPDCNRAEFCNLIGLKRVFVVMKCLRSAVACVLMLGSLGGAAYGQFAKDPQQPFPLDPEYRKLDALVSFLRERNAKQFAIRSAKGIDEAGYVNIEGIEQWVTIRGQDRTNPVLLFLHGGPGDVTNPWALLKFAPWETYFTVVQWDQRSAGRTMRKTGRAVASTMTLDRTAQDGMGLTEYLRQRLPYP